jgi:hypothetical protein
VIATLTFAEKTEISQNTENFHPCDIVNCIIIIILNLNVFFFYVWNGMLCTKYIIVYFLGNNFLIVLAGEV